MIRETNRWFLDLCDACDSRIHYVNHTSQNFRLLTHRINPLETFHFVCSCIRGQWYIFGCATYLAFRLRSGRRSVFCRRRPGRGGSGRVGSGREGRGGPGRTGRREVSCVVPRVMNSSISGPPSRPSISESISVSPSTPAAAAAVRRLSAQLYTGISSEVRSKVNA